MTIFLGAFLLFLVQPLLGKAILPSFGGTPAVWLTCLFFFQLLLLAGYAYAYVVSRLRSTRVQGALHLLALGAMLLWLPILPERGFAPGEGSPTLSILMQLLRCVGGPFLVLAATGPLVQSWYVRRFPGRSPYRLYALSNAGSLLALLGYPLLVEPSLALGAQATLWMSALVVFAVACGAWAWRVRGLAAADAPEQVADANVADDRPPRLDVALWFALSTCGSALLLATTSQISQNVAAVPLLWVVPLALYLVTFILCFEHPRWSRRGPVAWMLALALPAAGAAAAFGSELGMALQVAMLCFTLFAGCMACHGELSRLAPAPRHLGAFYLAIAAGGALGSALVTVVAPQVFNVVLEFPASLAAMVIAVLLARRRDSLLAWTRRPATRGPRRVAIAAGALLLVAALPGVASSGWSALLGERNVLEVRRNFYGVLLITDVERDDAHARRTTMTHGNTLHGVQFSAPERQREATSYYGPGSGVDLALAAARRRVAGPLRIGVVGMGAGTIASYAQAGDTLRFYEINPAVVDLATRYFTFCRDLQARGATLDVMLGDARLVLQGEADAGDEQRFDVLVVDAFSSDAIPVHLLTDECLALYRRHLAAGGILAFHVSNLFLDLAPVVRRLAQEQGLAAQRVIKRGDESRATTDTEWVLVLDEAQLQNDPALAAAATPWQAGELSAPLWTDDFSSLWPVLR